MEDQSTTATVAPATADQEQVGHEYILCVDIEKINRRPGKGIVGIGAALSKDGVPQTTFNVWLPFTRDMVDPATQTGYFDRNPGLLEHYLEMSKQAFDSIVKDLGPLVGNNATITNENLRRIVTAIQAERLTKFIDDLQMQLGPKDTFIMLTDFPEYDIAHINMLIYPARGYDLAHIAKRDPETGEIKYSWYKASVCTDNQFGVFLPSKQAWGFGSTLCKRWGVAPTENPHPHDPTVDARTILVEYNSLKPVMDRLVANVDQQLMPVVSEKPVASDNEAME